MYKLIWYIQQVLNKAKPESLGIEDKKNEEQERLNYRSWNSFPIIWNM